MNSVLGSRLVIGLKRAKKAVAFLPEKITGAEARKKREFIQEWGNFVLSKNRPHLCRTPLRWCKPETLVAILNHAINLSINNSQTAEETNNIILSFLEQMPEEVLQSVSRYLQTNERNLGPNGKAIKSLLNLSYVPDSYKVDDPPLLTIIKIMSLLTMIKIMSVNLNL